MPIRGNRLGDQFGRRLEVTGAEGLNAGGMQGDRVGASAILAGEGGWRFFGCARRCLRFIV